MSEEFFVCMLAAGLCVFVAGTAATFSIRNVVALIIGLLIGLPIVANMIAYTNAKHAHDHEPRIARSWR